MAAMPHPHRAKPSPRVAQDFVGAMNRLETDVLPDRITGRALARTWHDFCCRASGQPPGSFESRDPSERLARRCRDAAITRDKAHLKATCGIRGPGDARVARIRGCSGPTDGPALIKRPDRRRRSRGADTQCWGLGQAAAELRG